MQGKPAGSSLKEACYIESICSRCDFFDGTDDELECAAYKILLKLVEDDVITLAEISNARIDQSEKKA